MDETQKPFACCEKGCEMTFTNEDHLNWHQKKHDMMLNLGLTKNNDVADQTPTPTRFIRNCEEVGLFQDLQNVNPFDEFFKKAVETAKTGGTLAVPETNSDDTLHTPHILPHIEENQKKISGANNQDDNNSQSNDFSLNNVIPITTTIETTCENDNNATDCNSTPIIVIDDESTDECDVKMKIKEALQNKEKQKNGKENFTNPTNTSPITVVPFENLAIANDEPTHITDKTKRVELREKRRAMNRAAQIRCRKRKQKRWIEMEEEIISLKQENKKLRTENCNLRGLVATLKENALNSDSEAVQGSALFGRLVAVIQNQKTPTKGLCPAPVITATTPTTSTVTPNNNTPTIPNPIVIQILPNGRPLPALVPVANELQPNFDSIKIKTENDLSLSISPTKLNDTPEQQKVKRNNFRKIIPKINIEN